jgi:hypothetical protein
MTYRHLLLCGAALLLPLAAHAQSLQPLGANPAPSTAVNAGLGTSVPQSPAFGSGLVNLHDLIDAPNPDGATAQGQEITISAAIGAFAGYTDNVNLTAGRYFGKPKGSLEEHLSPSVSVAADTSHFQGTVSYAPDLRIFNRDIDANRVAHSLVSQGTARLLDDSLFLNLSALATQATTSLVSTYYGSPTVTSQPLSQVYSYSINPYFLHRFGDAANVKASYAYTGTIFDNGLYVEPGTPSKASNSAMQTEDLLLSSGPDYQTYSHALEASASQFLGGGSEHGGYRDLGTYTLTYAATHSIALIGMVGEEAMHYAAIKSGSAVVSKAYNFNGPIGQGGLRLTAKDNSNLTVLYGRIDGGNALTANGTLHLGNRVDLIVSSSTGLTTNGQDLQAPTNAATVGPDGTLTAGIGSSPQRYSLGVGATNNSVYRLTRSSISLLYGLDRDSFSLSANRNQTQNVDDSTTAGLNSLSLLGSVGWQHALTDKLSSSASFSYGNTRYNAVIGRPSVSHPVAGAGFRLADQLTDTLSIELDYNFSRQLVYGGSSVQSVNEVLAGVVQKF